jgi:hypothetical protein
VINSFLSFYALMGVRYVILPYYLMRIRASLFIYKEAYYSGKK